MLHPDANTVRLIHRHMIAEELARQRRPDRDDLERPGPRSVRARRLRHGVADLLRAVARRIEPGPAIEPPAKPAV